MLTSNWRTGPRCRRRGQGKRLGSRRSLLVLVAVVLAAIAAVTTFVYVRGIEARAYNERRLVEVFVVSAEIPKNTPGEAAAASAIRKARTPAQFRPANAINSLDEIKGKVALFSLSPNTVVVAGQFVEPRAAQVTFSQRIPAGNVAITVSVDQVRGVAGLLVPGDKVNILVLGQSDGRVLFQNVPVIAIGGTAAPVAGETGTVENPGSDLITFAVPPAAASRIAFAARQGGGLYLTLVPQDNQPVDIPPINEGNLFLGGPTPT